MGEHDGCQDRAAEERPEPYRVAAHRIRHQPEDGSRKQVGDDHLPQHTLLAGQAPRKDQRAAAPEGHRHIGGEGEGELAGFRKGEVEDGDEAEGRQAVQIAVQVGPPPR